MFDRDDDEAGGYGQRGGRGGAPPSPPSPSAGDDVVLYQSDRGPPDDRGKERLVVRLRQYNGASFVDLRLMFRGERGDYLPTKKGVSVRVREIDGVIAALEKARGEGR